MKTTGLTLGKFAPFHKGHEFLLSSALAIVDNLICLIYDSPTITNIPLTVRANWIRSIFPTVEVIELWDGPSEVGDTPEIKNMHETYILKLLNGRKITHFFCGEFYGEHMSIALNAQNCLIDPRRVNVPISGSEIRENPFQHREHLSPTVYKDYITNVVFLGAPSTGKSTLAAELAKTFNTVFMPEYGREYWESHQVNRRLSLEQLLEIAEGHLEREDQLLLKANKFLFTDTNALTTNMFSKYYHGRSHPNLSKYADNCFFRYDITFLCDSDIPYDDSWDRSGDANRQVFQKQIEADLICRKIPYILLSGTLSERMAKVESTLSRFVKFNSMGSFL
jgi:NadR type nicotinamide-nucleotide adenylyltransferase